MMDEQQAADDDPVILEHLRMYEQSMNEGPMEYEQTILDMQEFVTARKRMAGITKNFRPFEHALVVEHLRL